MLDGKQDISVMADRGFTIRDQLSRISVGLNIPPFMPSEEVQRGRKIASLCIHIERVIRLYKKLLNTLPLPLNRIANQIVSVCAWLLNFLIPPYTEVEEDTDSYLLTQFSSDSDYDADTEFSDAD